MAHLGPLGKIEDIDAEISQYRKAENQRMSEKEAVWHFPWRWIWMFSEWSGIGLGRFAPFVFDRMIARTGKQVK